MKHAKARIAEISRFWQAGRPAAEAGRQIGPGISCRISSAIGARPAELRRRPDWPTACSRGSGGRIRARQFTRSTQPRHDNADAIGRCHGASRRDVAERLCRQPGDDPGCLPAARRHDGRDHGADCTGSFDGSRPCGTDLACATHASSRFAAIDARWHDRSQPPTRRDHHGRHNNDGRCHLSGLGGSGRRCFRRFRVTIQRQSDRCVWCDVRSRRV